MPDEPLLVPFTTTEKRAAVEREITLRKRVYPRRVEDGKMSQKLADAQIAVMEAIAEDYRLIECKERLI